MRPTAIELVSRIRQAIDDTILPKVEDKIAASSLRSARVLLDHLASRLEHEPAFLAADNADAGAVLARAIKMLSTADAGPIRAAVSSAETSDPAQANDELQHGVELALAAVRRAPSAELHGELKAYLARRLERERPMFFPAFTAAPF
jgi:hypothetical protein